MRYCDEQSSVGWYALAILVIQLETATAQEKRGRRGFFTSSPAPESVLNISVDGSIVNFCICWLFDEPDVNQQAQEISLRIVLQSTETPNTPIAKIHHEFHTRAVLPFKLQ